MDPKKKSMIYVVTASLLVIRKLSEQAVSKGSGGEKILWLLAVEVTKPSKENGAGEHKDNIVSFSPLDLAETSTLFQ